MRTPWALLALALMAAPAAQAAQEVPEGQPDGSGPAGEEQAAEGPDRPPVTHRFGYSAYEAATVAAALAQLGLRPDAHPAGKVIEAIDAVRLEVIEERDPAPRFLNVFHIVSRPHVIERESLLRVGEPWRQALADETQRNLAELPQLSLVLVVAAEGSAPDRVRAVVITKDVWSLRLNWDAALTSSGLEELSLNPSETNFLGTHQLLGMLLHWLPLSTSLGGRYVVPRLLGSHVAASAQGGVILGPAGAREGSFGSAKVSLPLWSAREARAWGVDAGWLDEVTRLYRGGQLADFATTAGADCAGGSPLCVPWAYRTSTADADAWVTRSFGWSRKHDFTAGFSAHRGHYSLPDVAGRDPSVVAAFEATRVPVRDDRVGPWLQYQTYSSGFLRVLDLDTLALQEDVRMGAQALVRAGPALTALGSSVQLVAVTAGASYALALGDGLAKLSADTRTFVRTSDGAVIDGSVAAELRFASPRARWGRFVLDAALLDRYANRLHAQSYLGGDTRLRGYATELLVGGSRLVVNAELRSRPWQVLRSLQVGGVAFYDVGDAFDSWHALRLLQSVGVGARLLFPQLDRTVFRLDLAFPLSRPAGLDVAPIGFFATFGQAF